MPVTNVKINDTVAARLSGAGQAARQLVDTRVMPFAIPAGRKAVQLRKQFWQARQIAVERLSPAVENALNAAGPVRVEAARRGRLAAAALRGAEGQLAKKRRRWPVALVFLGIGGALGAGAAWLSQAGKPVQLTPLPLAPESHDTADIDSPVTDHNSDLSSSNGSHPLDLTDEAHAHHMH
jgi:hypothetical protein